MQSWENFEARVRMLAQSIWGPPCQPGQVGGVAVDGIVQLTSEIWNLVEITENAQLGKVREDVVKLQTARAAAFAKNILARCFCVVNGRVTESMVAAGREANIRVLTGDEFARMFFDFNLYSHARSGAPFGSSINPLTGAPDSSQYVPVEYVPVSGGKALSVQDIADLISDRKKVILLGEYGSGKSRCLRQLFDILKVKANKDLIYPLAIDLRTSWGLIDGGELVRRHVRSLGLDELESASVRAALTDSLCFLVDGFDEIGTQAWSNDPQKLREIRARALLGAKSLLSNQKSGAIVTGREHYFQDNDEMFSALGLSPKDTVVLRCKTEFSDTELLNYFENRNISVDLPDWLPRRPLICQTIADLPESELDSMLGDQGEEAAFWDHFMMTLCRRDARIHVSFDPDSIYQLFVNLARLTRVKPADVGPISPTEMEVAFEAAVGRPPVEEASAMLLRLPSMGRVSIENNDRQFIDVYILDGLRAKDVIRLLGTDDTTLGSVCSTVWVNELSLVGQKVMLRDGRSNQSGLLAIARKALEGGNAVLAGDIVASLVRGSGDPVDFSGLSIDQASFDLLDLTERGAARLEISNSYIGEFIPSHGKLSQVKIQECIAHKVTGISSEKALPSYVVNLRADAYDSVESVSHIKKIGLSPSQTILVTIVRKTFFQPGSGRKEEALMRGLGKSGNASLADKVLKMMLSEGLLKTFKGNEGTVYAPVRSHTERMQRILDELDRSQDELWRRLP